MKRKKNQPKTQDEVLQAAVKKIINDWARVIDEDITNIIFKSGNTKQTPKSTE